jgi:hypothetical protein
MKRIILTTLILLFITSVASAKDIKIYQTIAQSEFDQFIEEFGASLFFNPMAPAEPLGMTGFDVGLEAVATDISDSESYWRKLVEDSDPDSYLVVPRLHVQKGFPFNIDIGAMFVEVPDSNIAVWGVEAKYAILSGTVATPALSIRGSYSKLDGVEEISLNTQTLDVLISKGMLMFTPYAGISGTRIEGRENSDLVTLEKVDKTGFKTLVGLQFSPFPLFNINAEVNFGDVTQYGLKIGLRF